MAQMAVGIRMGFVVAVGDGKLVAGACVGVAVAGADGSLVGVSPVAGRDIEGPTASMKSVATIDFSLAPQGGIFNLKFTPQALDSGEKVRKLVSLIRGYCDAGGYHVQFNIVDDEILRDAQKNPEKYRGLLVRVAGWVAYFVELAKPVQDEIIQRYSHCL